MSLYSYRRRLAKITSEFIWEGLLSAPLPSRLALVLLEEINRHREPKPKAGSEIKAEAPIEARTEARTEAPTGTETAPKTILEWLKHWISELKLWMQAMKIILMMFMPHPKIQPRLTDFEIYLLQQLTLYFGPDAKIPKGEGRPVVADVLRSCLSPYREGSFEADARHDRMALCKVIYACLEDDPAMQADLSHATTYYPGKWLLELELSRRRPKTAELPDDGNPLPAETRSSWTEESDKRWDCNRNDVYNVAAQEQLTGLCFSGGGIRSATFNLGVLQTLAEFKLLRHFDYLSTVSGGGYIHQWLASWIYRAKGGIGEVEKKLVAPPASCCKPETPHEIFWLRRFSNYLTPQRGLFSADTWTLVSIWFRNTSLNQIVLFAFLGLVVLAGRGMTHLFVDPSWLQRHFVGPEFSVWHWRLASGFLLASVWLFATLSAGLLSVAVTVDEMGRRDSRWVLNFRKVVLRLVAPGFLLAVIVASLSTLKNASPGYCICWAISVFAVLIGTISGGELYKNVLEVRFGVKDPANASTGQRVWAGIVDFLFRLSAVAIAVGVYFAAHWIAGELTTADGKIAAALNQLLVTCKPAVAGAKPTVCTSLPAKWQFSPGMVLGVFAPPAFSVLLFFATHLQIGVIGRFLDESRREWLARLRGVTAMVCLGWIAFTAVGRIGPILFYRLFFAEDSWKRFYAIATFLVVHGVTLYAGASSKSSGKPSPGSFLGYKPLDLVGIVGAPIAILLLLVCVSGLLGFVAPHHSMWTAVVLLVVLLFFGWRVDVNEFSMHAFYRNRLARCYLGATNTERMPDPFTGFDDHETTTASGRSSVIAVADLVPRDFNPNVWRAPNAGAEPMPYEGRSYTGPYPIFSCTLNLTSGEELAFQERKGASFFFSPICSGYHVGWTTAVKGTKGEARWNGLVETKDYAYRVRGIQLPNAAAISGAALSPNQGFNSQPALAFLMTLFNVRLSWWIANPRRKTVSDKRADRPTPNFGLLSLLSELLGVSGDQTDYVSLCDGGFFENMGLYELVRRRCRYIVVCDAEQDENMTFGGIGNAIRKCRSDFGVEIDLDLRPLQLIGDTGFTTAHYQRGKITYPPPPGSRLSAKEFEGTIVYIKSSMTGDEPGDLLAHKNSEPSFPQDTTANQWFTESQFESYRRLGQLIASEALRPLDSPSSRSGLAAAFLKTKLQRAGRPDSSGLDGGPKPPRPGAST